MAKAACGKKKGSARAQQSLRAASDERARIVAAALEMAAEGRWRDARMSDLAQRTKIKLTDLYRLFPTREAILDEYIRMIDAATVAGGQYASDDPSTARDRLFDIVMRRLDAMTPHKAAVTSFMWHAAGDAYASLCVVFRLSRSLTLMLEAAGLSATGAVGALRIKGLALIWLNTLRIWLEDDSHDLAKTMAALDKALRHAESAASFFAGRRGRATSA